MKTLTLICASMLFVICFSALCSAAGPLQFATVAEPTQTTQTAETPMPKVVRALRPVGNLAFATAESADDQRPALPPATSIVLFTAPDHPDSAAARQFAVPYLEAGDWQVMQVPAGSRPDLVGLFAVRKAPTFIILRHDTECGRLVGFDRRNVNASLDRLGAEIEKANRRRIAVEVNADR